MTQTPRRMEAEWGSLLSILSQAVRSIQGQASNFTTAPTEQERLVSWPPEDKVFPSKLPLPKFAKGGSTVCAAEAQGESHGADNPFSKSGPAWLTPLPALLPLLLTL